MTAPASTAEDVIQLHTPAHDKTVYANTSQLIATEEPDFPSFLFSEKELHRSVKVFKKGFDGLLTYAVKCNPSPHVIKQLHDEGLKAFDVASNREMELVRDFAPGAAMHYNNPIKNKREIERAYEEFGIRSFTIDHPQQLDQLAAIVTPSRDIEEFRQLCKYDPPGTDCAAAALGVTITLAVPTTTAATIIRKLTLCDNIIRSSRMYMEESTDARWPQSELDAGGDPSSHCETGQRHRC